MRLISIGFLAAICGCSSILGAVKKDTRDRKAAEKNIAVYKALNRIS